MREEREEERYVISFQDQISVSFQLVNSKTVP